MATDPPEAVVTINGRRLTQGQSLALRVAAESLRTEMCAAAGTGGWSDELGERIRQNYVDRLREVLTLMLGSPRNGRPGEDE